MDYLNDLNINGSIADIIMNTDLISGSLIEGIVTMRIDCDLTGSEIYLKSIKSFMFWY